MGELDDKLNAILGDPQAMGQIMALARSLGAGGGEEQENQSASQPEPDRVPPPVVDTLPSLGDLDPRLLQLGMRVLKEYQREDDEKTALLKALRPFVKEKRYDKLDRAIQIARLSRVIRILFDAMGKEEGRV